MLFKNWMRENTFVRQINPWKEGFIINLYRFIGTNTVPITVETEFFFKGRVLFRTALDAPFVLFCFFIREMKICFN